MGWVGSKCVPQERKPGIRGDGWFGAEKEAGSRGEARGKLPRGGEGGGAEERRGAEGRRGAERRRVPRGQIAEGRRGAEGGQGAEGRQERAPREGRIGK